MHGTQAEVDLMVSTWRCEHCGRTYIGAWLDGGLLLAGNEAPHPVYIAPTVQETSAIAGACSCGSGIHLASRFAAFVRNGRLLSLDTWPMHDERIRLN